MRARSVVYVCSNERAAGKTALIIDMALRLKRAGFAAAYWKPFDEDDRDIAIVSRVLDISLDNIPKPLAHNLPPGDYQPLLGENLRRLTSDCQVLFVEGSGRPDEEPDEAMGELLRGARADTGSEAKLRAVYIARYNGGGVDQDIRGARERLADMYAGAIINAVPPDHAWFVRKRVTPELAERGITVLGVLPQELALATTTIGQLVARLGAQILVHGGNEALDETFESVMLGSMSAEDAHRYFSRRQNKLVVTRGDRPDVHMAALGTSTRCLLLAGGYPSYPFVLDRAETLGIPIISVDTEVSTTIESLDALLASPLEHGGSKIKRFGALLDAHMVWQRLAVALALPEGPSA